MRESEKVRLAILGCGQHASVNIYPVLHFLKGVEFAANCDLDENKAKAMAAAFGLPRSYSDYRAMLDAERLDGVIVCVGPEFHARVAAEIMERGLHVYTEKPNAESLEASRAALAVQRRTGRIAMTGYKKRFAPAYVKARSVIQSAEFGRPALLTVLRTKGHPNPDTGQSDYLLHWACHVIDLMPFLFGPVAQVSALQTERTTHAYAVNLRFVNGALGQLALTDRAGKVWEEITAVGSNMVNVRVSNAIEMMARRMDQPFAAHAPIFSVGVTQSAIEEGFVGELQAFADAIRNGAPPESSLEQATHSMSVYEAIRRSIASGNLVEVEAL